MRRQPIAVALVAALVIGYAARFWLPVPEPIRDGSGGIAYVIFWMLLGAFVRPPTSARLLTLAVLAATCAIEFAQLWHPSWLEALRRTFPGRLVLGTTFSWLDFPPYFAGAALGYWLLQNAKGAARPTN